MKKTIGKFLAILSILALLLPVTMIQADAAEFNKEAK